MQGRERREAERRFRVEVTPRTIESEKGGVGGRGGTQVIFLQEEQETMLLLLMQNRAKRWRARTHQERTLNPRARAPPVACRRGGLVALSSAFDAWGVAAAARTR